MMQSSLTSLRLQMIGCGNMGSALLAAWLEGGLSAKNVSISVTSDASKQRLETEFPGVQVHVNDMPDVNADIIVLGVKPQQMDTVTTQLEKRDALFLTLAAGLPLSHYPFPRIVRAMPNTPVRVGHGVTSLVANDISDADRVMVDALFAPTGHAFWLKNEAQMALATAIAGSGPAYVYYLEEALTELATEMGLGAEQAALCVQHTLRGSLALEDHAKLSPTALREQVTSKGGVTAAALEVLMQPNTGLKSLFKQALLANMARNKELSS